MNKLIRTTGKGCLVFMEIAGRVCLVLVYAFMFAWLMVIMARYLGMM